MLGGWFLPAVPAPETQGSTTPATLTPQVKFSSRPSRAVQPAPEASQAPLESGSCSAARMRLADGQGRGWRGRLPFTTRPRPRPSFSPRLPWPTGWRRVRFSDTDQGQPLQVQLNLANGATLHFDRLQGQAIRFR